jgi:hypothetical protein
VTSAFSTYKQVLSEVRTKVDNSAEGSIDLDDSSVTTLMSFKRNSRFATSHCLELLKSACLLWHCSAVSIFTRPDRSGVDGSSSNWETAISQAVANSDLTYCYSLSQNNVNQHRINGFVDEAVLGKLIEGLSVATSKLGSFVFESVEQNTNDQGVFGFSRLEKDVAVENSLSLSFPKDVHFYHVVVQLSYFCNALTVVAQELAVIEVADASTETINDRLVIVGRVDTLSLAMSSIVKHVDYRISSICKILEDDDTLGSLNQAMKSCDSLLVGAAKARNTLRSALDAMVAHLHRHNQEQHGHSELFEVLGVVEASVTAAVRFVTDQLAESSSTAVSHSVEEINIASDKSLLLWRWISDPSIKSPVSAVSATRSTNQVNSPAWVHRCKALAAEVGEWNNAVASVAALRSRAESAEIENSKLLDQFKSARLLTEDLSTELAAAKSRQVTSAITPGPEEDKLRKEIQVC